MPELWLRKVFRRVIFLNSNMPEKRCRMFRDKEELDELPENSTDIFQRNILDRDQIATFSTVNMLKQMTFVLLNFYHVNMYNQN